MQRTSRRHFVRVASGATAGMATWLALGKAPALAQKRELTFLSPPDEAKAAINRYVRARLELPE